MLELRVYKLSYVQNDSKVILSEEGAFVLSSCNMEISLDDMIVKLMPL